MKIKITNKTHWRTDDLRRYLRAALEHEVGKDPTELRRWLVEIRYSRAKSQVSGYAWLNTRTFVIRIPKRIWVHDGGTGLGRWDDPVKLPRSVLRWMLRVIIHEIGHCLGLEHRDMIPISDIPTEFYGELTPVRRRAAASPPEKPDKKEQAMQKVQRVNELIAAEQRRHATNMKKLRTRRKKALASLKYYERKEQDS